jgi:hypothetical protein
VAADLLGDGGLIQLDGPAAKQVHKVVVPHVVGGGTALHDLAQGGSTMVCSFTAVARSVMSRIDAASALGCATIRSVALHFAAIAARALPVPRTCTPSKRGRDLYLSSSSMATETDG